LTNRNNSYIVLTMIKEIYAIDGIKMDHKTEWFISRCRETGLKVTPQRLAIYHELLKTDEHPSAEMMYHKIKKEYPNISLDTVNRTLMTLSDMGAANIVEGSGDSRRFDGDLDEHQHFKCVKCKKIIDFHHKPFDVIRLPKYISKKFKVLKKTVYIEGICDCCMNDKD
jgi:Fur family transcriptional regulator, peroxide stress response regulator